MKQFALFLFVFIFKFNLFCQDKKLIQETVDFVVQTYSIPESNPIMHEESVLIDGVFRTLLLDYFEIKKADSVITTEHLLKLLYQNSISEYDDSPDIRRMKMRRSLCFSSLALKTDLPSSNTLIDYAKYSIVYKCPDNIESLLETDYCGLLFFELLLNSKRKNYNNKYDLQIIKEFLSDNQNKIDPKYLDQAEYLISEFDKIYK